jgi:hypothetical protein
MFLDQREAVDSTQSKDDHIDSALVPGLLSCEEMHRLVNTESVISVSQVNISLKWGNGENYRMCYLFIYF